MNIENKHLELSCSGFGDKFLKYFDWNDMDVTYSRVDVTNNVVKVISNHYEWVLMFWDDDLDKKVKERLTPVFNIGIITLPHSKKHYLKQIRKK